MAEAPVLTLDQLGVPNEIRERAKMLWIFTLVGGLWGWIICNFVWKVEGQDQNEWYQRQLKQAMVIGGISWVLSVFMGIGWFVSAVLSFLGFQAIGKGDDYIAPVVGSMILGAAIPTVGASSPAPQQAAQVESSAAQGWQQPAPAQGWQQPAPAQGWQQPVQQPVQQENPFFVSLKELNLQALDPQDHGRIYPTTFDIRNDLMGYFIAQREIEMVAENPAELDQALRRYGIRDLEHFQTLREAVNNWIFSTHPGRAAYPGGQDQIAQIQINAAMEYQKRAQASRAASMSSEFEPVEGISLQQWAWAQANLAQSHPIDSLLGQLQCDRARWDRVSAEWNARMSRDTTATIATEYGKAFTGTGAGQYGAAAQAVSNTMNVGASNTPAGAEPIPFEKFVELAVATEAAAIKGWDVNALLEQHGLNAANWAAASAWWYQQCAARAMDAAFQARWDQLKKWYESHYKGASSDSDIEY